MIEPIGVFAWGNRGRGDDGAALALAERLETRFAERTDVVVYTYHQLGPEVVDDLAGSSFAIFVDANVEPDAPPVDRSRVRAARSSTLDSHHCSPAELLALGHALGLQLPESWLIGIRAQVMDFNDDLSPETAACVARAERVILNMIDRRQRRAPELADA